MMLNIHDISKKVSLSSIRGQVISERGLYLHNEQGFALAYLYNMTASVRLPA